MSFSTLLYGARIVYGQVEEKGYAVVVVAEGAGEELLGESTAKDASGSVQSRSSITQSSTTTITKEFAYLSRERNEGIIRSVPRKQ